MGMLSMVLGLLESTMTDKGATVNEWGLNQKGVCEAMAAAASGM